MFLAYTIIYIFYCFGEFVFLKISLGVRRAHLYFYYFTIKWDFYYTDGPRNRWFGWSL